MTGFITEVYEGHKYWGAGVGSNDNSMGRLATVRERVREHILFCIFGWLEMLHICLKCLF